MVAIFKNFAKEIYSLRLSITTRCPLDCAYCFVVKDNRDMSEDIAFNAIDFLLRSPGEKKLLQIYGGEPFLRFDFFKAIVIKVRHLAETLGKKIRIHVASNGILIEKSHLDFLRENHVRLAVSIDGQQAFHDQARLTRGKTSVYQGIIAKIPGILAAMRPSDVSVLVGILPASASHLYDNLRYLIDLGFTNFKLEMVRNRKYKWDQKHFDQFKLNLSKFVKYIEDHIPERKFIFLQAVNDELYKSIISESLLLQCPFIQHLEVYPDGEIAFSPFLINHSKKDYAIGRMSAYLEDPYLSCVFDPKNSLCRNCWGNYHRRGDAPGDEERRLSANKIGEVIRLRDIFAIYFARKILAKENRDPLYKEYRREAEKRI